MTDNGRKLAAICFERSFPISNTIKKEERLHKRLFCDPYNIGY